MLRAMRMDVKTLSSMAQSPHGFRLSKVSANYTELRSIIMTIDTVIVTWKAKTDTNALPCNGTNRLLSV